MGFAGLYETWSDPDRRRDRHRLHRHDDGQRAVGAVARPDAGDPRRRETSPPGSTSTGSTRPTARRAAAARRPRAALELIAIGTAVNRVGERRPRSAAARRSAGARGAFRACPTARGARDFGQVELPERPWPRKPSRRAPSRRSVHADGLRRCPWAGRRPALCRLSRRGMGRARMGRPRAVREAHPRRLPGRPVVDHDPAQARRRSAPPSTASSPKRSCATTRRRWRR